MKMQKGKYIIYWQDYSFYQFKCVRDSNANWPKDLNNLALVN